MNLEIGVFVHVAWQKLSQENICFDNKCRFWVIVDDCGELKGKSFPGWTVVQSTDEIKSKHREERIVNANVIGYKKLLELTNYKVEFIAHLEGNLLDITALHEIPKL